MYTSDKTKASNIKIAFERVQDKTYKVKDTDIVVTQAQKRFLSKNKFLIRKFEILQDVDVFFLKQKTAIIF